MFLFSFEIRGGALDYKVGCGCHLQMKLDQMPGVKQPPGSSSWSASSPYELAQGVHVAESVIFSAEDQEAFFLKKTEKIAGLGPIEPSEDLLVKVSQCEVSIATVTVSVPGRRSSCKALQSSVCGLRADSARSVHLQPRLQHCEICNADSRRGEGPCHSGRGENLADGGDDRRRRSQRSSFC